MTGSAFTEPPQGASLDELWRHLAQLIYALNGSTSWQRLVDLTGTTDNSSYLVTLKNQGSGGHLNIPSVLAINSTGLTTPLQITSTLATGTAPFVVASTTKVANLNVSQVDGRVPGTGVGNLAFYDAQGRVADSQLLDGQEGAAFLTQALGDLRYLQLTGGTLTGALTIQANQGLKLKNGASDGTITLNATAAADPTLEFKDNSGDDVVKIYPSGSTYSLETLGPIRAGTNLVVNDWTLTVSGDDLVFQDDAAQEIFRVGDTASTYHAKVTGPMHITGEIKLDGALNHDGTTVGFFNSTPDTRQTVSGSRADPEAALKNLLSALANYGLITNSTTA